MTGRKTREQKRKVQLYKNTDIFLLPFPFRDSRSNTITCGVTVKEKGPSER